MSRRLDQERQDNKEPERMASCTAWLEAAGYKVTRPYLSVGEINFEHKKQTIRFWPYSGWWAGKGIGSGRGFAKLVSKLQKRDVSQP